MASRELPPSVQQQLVRLQQLQQTLNVLLAEKQRVESELAEINNALEELNKVDEGVTIYKAVGSVLIQTSKSKLLSELNERKELADTRLKVLERQEARTRSQLDELQKEVQKALSGQAPS